MLKRVQAILEVPKGATGVIRLHHPSFRDFLLNRDRCQDSDLWVNKKHIHLTLAANCIQLMSKTLRRDICEMHRPGCRASEVASSRLRACLPSEVQYACLY
jgi:hypothetical protein